MCILSVLNINTKRLETYTKFTQANIFLNKSPSSLFLKFKLGPDLKCCPDLCNHAYTSTIHTTFCKNMYEVRQMKYFWTTLLQFSHFNVRYYLCFKLREAMGKKLKKIQKLCELEEFWAKSCLMNGQGKHLLVLKVNGRLKKILVS